VSGRPAATQPWVGDYGMTRPSSTVRIRIVRFEVERSFLWIFMSSVSILERIAAA
jgi:hypothetical protein